MPYSAPRCLRCHRPQIIEGLRRDGGHHQDAFLLLAHAISALKEVQCPKKQTTNSELACCRPGARESVQPLRKGYHDEDFIPRKSPSAISPHYRPKSGQVKTSTDY